MPETADQPIRLTALPAEQAAGFRAAARAVVDQQAPAAMAAGEGIRIAVPAEGSHQAVLVEPGQAVTLDGEAFREAVYVMQPEGLVVLVEGGGTLLLPGLEAATPIVIDGLPPVLAGDMAAAPAVQPAAGPAMAHGGGAGFATIGVESIGGLDATGALAGTARDYAVAFGELPSGRLDSPRTAAAGPSGGEPGKGDPDEGEGPDDGEGPDHGGPSRPGGGDPGPIANARPLAGDDRASTAEDHRLTLRAADLLRNDGDTDGTALHIAAVDGARHGQVALNADGSITFTPDADFNGDASFRYTVSDGEGGSDTATVRVAVRPLNDAPVAAADAVATQEDRAIRIPVSQLLGNDHDVDGDRLTIAAVQKASHGQVTLNGDGTITFTPDADFHGQAGFTYTVSDGKGGFDTARVQVEVTPANDAPVAADDGLRTDEDRALRIEAATLLGNDRDIDHDPLHIVSVQDASHGQVVLNPDGSIGFTPDADFHGEASFTYTVSDGKGGVDTARVLVEVAPVNDAPIATDDRLTTAEDSAIRMARGFFTGDDHDVDGDPLRIVSVQKAEHGTVELTKNHVVFTPDADFNGEASFTYTISDGHGGLDTATVRVQVTPVNDAPVATCDNVYTDEDTPAVFNERRLSSDDFDVDGDRLKVISVQDAEQGTVLLNADGTVTFTPDADFNGEASFTYTVSDGKGGFDTAGVKVHVAPVNDAPSLADAALTARQGSPAESFVGRIQGWDPDSSATEHGRLYYAFATGGPVPFSLFSGDGAFVIDPFTGAIFTAEALDPQALGPHELQVVAMDGGGLFDMATVTIAVEANEAPVGAADLVLTNRTDGAAIAIPSAALLHNDADPEGAPLHVADVGGDAPVGLDAAGDMVLDPIGSVFTGASLTYSPADTGGLAGAPVAVTVMGIAGDVIEGGEAAEIILGRNGAADDLRGGGGDDWLVGHGGDDQLDGGDGQDVLDGGAGKDRLDGGKGKDDLRGGGGGDELHGQQGQDDLRGGAGKDVLDGGLGSDLLDGGAGDDLLTGGGGADRFRFAHLGGTDRIADFQAGAGGDVIDLRAILVGVGSESGAELQGWLQITVADGDSTIAIDADGGGDFAAADARIVAEGVDLLGGAVDQAAAIDSLVANGNVQAQQAA
jgi:hypothetical protein